MTWFGRFRRRAALDRDLERELQDHLERRTEALIAAGLTPGQARRQARLESGGAEQVKEAVRDIRGTRWAHDLLQDVRYGIRSLRRSPGLLVAATLSLGLGIGANAAMFALVDALLLRTLPVRDPEALVMLRGGSWTNPIWEEIQRHAGTRFAGAVAWSEERFDLSRGGETDPVDGLFVSGTFFETLGVQPALGRMLGPADDRRGGGPDGPTTVISHRFWQRRFEGDPAVVGRTLLINQVPFTIVGVVPARFLGPTVGRSFDIAVPVGTVDALRPGGPQSALDGRSMWWLDIMFRLRPEQTIDSAVAALRSVQPQVRLATLPQTWSPSMQAQFLTDPWDLDAAATGRSELRKQYRQPLLILMGLVGAVLLVACGNVGNLLLARGEARRHELTARLALGASYGRVVRQLLAESLVLVVPGTLLGLAVALWGARLLVTQLGTSDSAVALPLPLDWRLLGFLAGLALATGIAFGLVPAWRARRLRAGDAIAQSSHGRVTRRGAVSGPLVVGQVALSLVLIVAAGLFGRTFLTLATRDLGFEPDGLVQASLELRRAPAAERPALIARLREAAAQVPGVRAAAVAVIEPMSGMGWNESIEVVGGPMPPNDDQMTWLNAVTPGWFAAYGTPLVAGRDFHETDRRGGAHVAIVNEAFARRFFAGQPAVGRQVSISVSATRRAVLDIVGVAGDAAYRDLKGPLPATLYRPIAQMEEPFPFATLSVRTAPGGAAGLAANLTRALNAVRPDVAVTYRSLSARLHDHLSEARTVALLSGFFGGLALLLAAIGLYGVTSYGVNERRREIGIRLTLGADRSAAERFVLGRVARLVGLGVVLGLAVSVALSPLVRALLYELEPRDPATIALAAAVLGLVGLLAGWVPARRAARIDPARVLREG